MLLIELLITEETMFYVGGAREGERGWRSSLKNITGGFFSQPFALFQPLLHSKLGFV
jgi:hypothetical protein